MDKLSNIFLFKKHQYFLVFGLLSFVFCEKTIAQSDSTTLLQTVEITEKAIRNLHIGGTGQVWDSLALQKNQSQNLGQLLASEGQVFIKNYGLGTLATSSVRGGAAGHTAVLWNGLPIQSPMLGLLDFSLLPTGFVDGVDVQYGGGSALWGSGAIGAVVNLNNRADFSKKRELKSQSTVGSFGQFQQQLQFRAGNGRLQSTTRLLHQQATNDFSYRIAPDFPKQKQSNAALSQQALMQSLYFKKSAKEVFETHFWQQYSNRELPPTTAQNRSQAEQKDRVSRLAFSYKNIAKNAVSKAKLGFFNEKIHYTDAASGIDAPSHFQTFMAELDRQWAVSQKHTFYLGTTQLINKAWADGYGDSARQEYRAGLFASHRFAHKTWQIQGSLRQEFLDGKAVPLVPVLGFEKMFFSTLLLRGKLSKNYRLPTLNDRFWLVGGNPNLKPENGWSSELGLDFSLKNEHFQAKYSTTGFNRRIKNWILWSKTAGQVFWSAQNVAEVWSRGIEQRLDFIFSKNKTRLGLAIGHDFVRSTHQIASITPKIEAGTQLFYVPKHLFKTTFSWQKEAFGFSYRHNFTGSYDGVNYLLPAYHLAAFSANYAWTFSKINGTAFFTVDNIWDVSYEIIERRSMPGRSFQVGCSVVLGN